MRPIVWGLILSVLGAFFWILFSVVFGIASGMSRTSMPAGYWALIYITGLAMVFGIPAGIVGEAVRWYRGKKAAKSLAPRVYRPSTATVARYCHRCGKQVRLDSIYCSGCGARL